MIEIKENKRELQSVYRFYVTKNGKVIRERMTLKEAEKLKERLSA